MTWAVAILSAAVLCLLITLAARPRIIAPTPTWLPPKACALGTYTDGLPWRSEWRNLVWQPFAGDTTHAEPITVQVPAGVTVTGWRYNVGGYNESGSGPVEFEQPGTYFLMVALTILFDDDVPAVAR